MMVLLLSHKEKMFLDDALDETDLLQKGNVPILAVMIVLHS